MSSILGSAPDAVILQGAFTNMEETIFNHPITKVRPDFSLLYILLYFLTITISKAAGGFVLSEVHLTFSFLSVVPVPPRI